MQFKLVNFLFRGKKEQNDIADEIEGITRQLKEARNRFEYSSDNDMVDSCIYEINSLSAKYSYLLRMAKSNKKDL